MENDLVSIIICTYNQQHCIADAIKSAFRQTYHPLEIIISDDCSTDSTISVINEEICKYKGPHRVHINKNQKNLGIAMHWDYISRKANGKLIVHAAGDDISLPNRVQEIVCIWKSLNPRPYLLSSNGIKMTIDGVDTGSTVICQNKCADISIQSGPKNFDFDHFDVPITGFSLAIDRRLYETFAPLTQRMWSEDSILRSRALLLGSIVFIPKVLVRYRDGGLSKGCKPNKEDYIQLYNDQAISRRNYLEQIRSDYYDICSSPPAQFLENINNKLASASRRLRMVDTGSFAVSLSMLCLQLINSKNEGLAKREYLNTFAVRWFPEAFFFVRSLRHGASTSRSRARSEAAPEPL